MAAALAHSSFKTAAFRRTSSMRLSHFPPSPTKLSSSEGSLGSIPDSEPVPPSSSQTAGSRHPEESPTNVPRPSATGSQSLGTILGSRSSTPSQTPRSGQGSAHLSAAHDAHSPNPSPETSSTLEQGAPGGGRGRLLGVPISDLVRNSATGRSSSLAINEAADDDATLAGAGTGSTGTALARRDTGSLWIVGDSDLAAGQRREGGAQGTAQEAGAHGVAGPSPRRISFGSESSGGGAGRSLAPGGQAQGGGQSGAPPLERRLTNRLSWRQGSSASSLSSTSGNAREQQPP